MKKVRLFVSCLVLVYLGLFLFLGSSFVYAQGQEKPPVVTLTTSALSVVSVGDREKFEEDHWVSRNVSGGLEDFGYFKEYTNGDSLELRARAIGNNNDYGFNADYEKEGVGSLKFAFKDFRKYFDGTGGFAGTNFSTRFFEINQDLHLDMGSFKLEGILAKEGAPKYTFSYERAFKNGDKSLTSWTQVTPASGDRKYINPSFMEIDEIVNKVKVGVEHKIKDVNVSAEQRWEGAVASQEAAYRSIKTLSTGALTDVRTEYDDYDYDNYSTILRCDKTWAEKIFSSLGFMYNRYIGGSIESISDSDTGDGVLPSPATLEQNTVTLLPNVSFSLNKDLLMDTGLKFEYVKKDGYSSLYSDSDGNGVVDGTTNFKTKREDRVFGQNFELKYKKFKNAVFYTEADLEQRFVDLNQNQELTSAFMRIAGSNEFNNNFTLGNKWYVFSNFDVTTEVKRKGGLKEYKQISKTGSSIIGRYSGFISTLDFVTYSPVLKLNYKPYRWIGYNFGYNHDRTSYGVRTPARDSLEMNSYKAHVYSLNLTLTPQDYLYFTLFYQKKNTTTHTRADGDGNPTAVVPNYNGNVNVAGLNWSYAPNAKNTIIGSYSMSKTENFNDFMAIGLPVGSDNLTQTASIGVEHQLRKDLSVELKYSFMQYSDDANDGIDNYEVNLIYTGLKMQF